MSVVDPSPLDAAALGVPISFYLTHDEAHSLQVVTRAAGRIADRVRRGELILEQGSAEHNADDILRTVTKLVFLVNNVHAQEATNAPGRVSGSSSSTIDSFRGSFSSFASSDTNLTELSETDQVLPSLQLPPLPPLPFELHGNALHVTPSGTTGNWNCYECPICGQTFEYNTVLEGSERSQEKNLRIHMERWRSSNWLNSQVEQTIKECRIPTVPPTPAAFLEAVLSARILPEAKVQALAELMKEKPRLRELARIWNLEANTMFPEVEQHTTSQSRSYFNFKRTVLHCLDHHLEGYELTFVPPKPAKRTKKNIPRDSVVVTQRRRTEEQLAGRGEHHQQTACSPDAPSRTALDDKLKMSHAATATWPPTNILRQSYFPEIESFSFPLPPGDTRDSHASSDFPQWSPDLV